MMLPRVNRKTTKPVRPLKPHELTALRKSRKGVRPDLIDRLLLTLDQGMALEKQECLTCKYSQDEVKWIGWPDLEPVNRTAEDWLRLAILALIEYEEQQLTDRLRTEGKWQLWQ